MKRYIFAILSIVLSSGQYHAMEDPFVDNPEFFDALYAAPDKLQDLALFNPTLAQSNRAMGDYSTTAEFPSTDHLTQPWDERMNAPSDEPFNPFSIQDSIRFAREDATTIARGEHASQEIAPVIQPAIRTGASKGIPGYCPVCLQHLTSLRKLSNHIQIQHPLSKDNFACPKCPKKFQFPDNLKGHITIVHPKRLLQCTQCENTYKSQQSLKQHMKDSHDEQTTFPCSMCPKTYKGKTSLNRHMKKEHQQDQINPDEFLFLSVQSAHPEDSSDFAELQSSHALDASAVLSTSPLEEPPSKRRKEIMSIAALLTQDSSELTPPSQDIADSSQFQCPICHQKLKSTQNLSQHIQTEHPLSKDNTCPQCPKKFPLPSKLKKHIAIVHTATLLQCTQCKNKYKSEESLKRHIQKIHMASGTFNCDMCSLQFISEKQFKQHIKQHTTSGNSDRVTETISCEDPLPFQCPICPQKLQSMQRLSQHIKEEHPLSTDNFACPQCPKKFPLPKKLKNHITIVHPERLLQCTQCENTYKSQQALKQHIKETHERTAQTFPCGTCTSKFSRERLLKDHMRKKHS